MRTLRETLCIASVALFVGCGPGILTVPVHTARDSTSSSGGSGTGGSAGASTSGGSSTGAPTNAGCDENPDAGSPLEAEFYGCFAPDECPCPLACVRDPAFGLGDNCENLCPADAGSYCDDTATLCNGGICRTNFCHADGTEQSLPGAIGGLCSAVGGSGMGTCLPEGPWTPYSTQPLIGLCFQGGTLQAGEECDDGNLGFFSRANPQCEPGTACIGPICVSVGPGGCIASRGYGDHQACSASTVCDCPLNCVQQVAGGPSLCEAPCDDGGTCAGSRTCLNGFCD